MENYKKKKKKNDVRFSFIMLWVVFLILFLSFSQNTENNRTKYAHHSIFNDLNMKISVYFSVNYIRIKYSTAFVIYRTQIHTHTHWSEQMMWTGNIQFRLLFRITDDMTMNKFLVKWDETNCNISYI